MSNEEIGLEMDGTMAFVTNWENEREGIVEVDSFSVVERVETKNYKLNLPPIVIGVSVGRIRLNLWKRLRENLLLTKGFLRLVLIS